MNVLSLFDGMSCGQIALKELGFPVNIYYASEIDKYAIKQSTLNFPDTIHLGSVTTVNVSDLKAIDLLIGGSPCQSFSFAGKRKGMVTKCEIEILSLDHYLELKSNGFEFEGQSYLFWEYMRILTEIWKYNPDVKFLLENVEMGEKWEKVLSKAIGVNGIHINSALVSAQNRKRIYWTNIGLEPAGLFGYMESTIEQPKDRGILLKDILQPESEVDGKYYLSDKVVSNLIAHKKRHKENGNGFGAVFHKEDEKMQALKIRGKGIDDLICVAMRGREACLTPKRTEYGKEIRKQYESKAIAEQRKNIQKLEPRTDNKTNCLTSVQKDNLIAYGCDYRKDEGFRVRKEEKSNTLMARAREDIYGTGLVKIPSLIRRLTPTECNRLQTIPDWYKWEVSDTHQYKLLGNGWTIKVIIHILRYLCK